MEVMIRELVDDKFVEFKRYLTNFNVIKDKDGISFSVRLLDKEGGLPHEGFINFNNIKSKSLNEVLSLLYKIVGMIYEDSQIRQSIGSIDKDLEKIHSDLIMYDEKIREVEEKFAAAKVRVECAENMPEVLQNFYTKYQDLARLFEDFQLELLVLGRKYIEKKEEKYREEYLTKVKENRKLVRELNEMVEIINDKENRKLNTLAELDRYQLEKDKLEIERQILLEKAIVLRNKSTKVTPKLIYTTKRLGLEEDYEL